MTETLCLLTSDTDAVLVRRARELALAPSLETETHELFVLDVLFFTVAGQAFAVETRFVLGAGRVEQVLPLPGTPGFIAGVLLWEGRILALNNLALLLGLNARPADSAAMPEPDADRGRLAVAMHGPQVEAPRLELLFQVDSLLGVGGLDRRALPGGEDWRQPPPVAGRLGHCRRALIRADQVRELESPPAVTSFLDMELLLADPALTPGTQA